jgi:hypothetical protein
MFSSAIASLGKRNVEKRMKEVKDARTLRIF